MHSIRWKLILMTSLVVFLPVYFLNRKAVQAFDRFTSRALEAEMVGYARIVGEQYRSATASADGESFEFQADFTELLETVGPKVEARIRIVSPEGQVLFDSEPSAVSPKDLSGRSEMARAMRGIYGARWTLTADSEFVFYYVALPIMEDGKVIGIAYVSRHTGPIIKAIRQMVREQRAALLAALAVAILVSAVLSLTVTLRLRRLTVAVRKYARGGALEVCVRGKDEIGELAQAVTQMSAEIENRNAYNRDFVSTVMHELRTPLTAIKGASEVLAGTGGARPETREKFLANIRFETDRMTRMVSELTALTRLDTEAVRGRQEEVDYGACVREVVERILPTFDAGHAPIRVTLPDEPLRARVLTGRIEQVLGNLLENAVRYTPPTGAIDVIVEAGDAETIITTVRDTGSGIAPANLDRVFDRFFTTEPKDVSQDYGSGLGLAIAKSIIDSHRGTLRVESTPGNGASFIFTLPAA